MTRILLAAALLAGGYYVLQTRNALPQSLGGGPSSGGKILAGGSVAGTIGAGVKGAARKMGN